MMTDQINRPEEPQEDSQPANQTDDISPAAVSLPDADDNTAEAAAAPEQPEAAADRLRPVAERSEPDSTEVVIQSENGSETATAAQTEAEAMSEHREPNPVPTKTKRAKKVKARRKTASPAEVRKITDAFAACVRCGYFLSDYRMLFGEEHFGTVVADSREDWLDMRWSDKMRKTVEKSFGIRIDNNIDSYQGCCDMCRRNFVFSIDEQQVGSMRVQVRMAPPQPRRRR